MFRRLTKIERLVAFGNCDAATALALFGETAGIDALILANPWTFEDDGIDKGHDDTPALPPAAAIRARYLSRLRDPRQIWRLVSGGVDLRKLANGLRAARHRKSDVDGLARELINALVKLRIPATILLAERDRTAIAFAEAWRQAPVATQQRIPVAQCPTASHSFADDTARQWLADHIRDLL
jgi:hypothetical protein